MSEVAVRRPPGQLRSLLRCSHPKQALLIAVVIAGAAALSDRAGREVLVAGAAVLLAQVILGIHNDVADVEYDVVSGIDGKPIAADLLPVGNATFVIAALTLLAIPLSLQNGTVAGFVLLGTLVVGFAHNRFVHRSAFSWIGWTVTFGLLPAFLSYGGWSGGVHGDPPTVAITLTAAALGFCVHFMVALPDLVADNLSGARHLPLRAALRIGAPRLLVVSSIFTVLAIAGVVVSALSVGLRQ
ncbi:MAG: hypothetical protein JWR35_2107 [Marmoricola sp.]|nr:hypothetical protein [Marmoricola sp.]